MDEKRTGVYQHRRDGKDEPDNCADIEAVRFNEAAYPMLCG